MTEMAKTAQHKRVTHGALEAAIDQHPDAIKIALLTPAQAPDQDADPHWTGQPGAPQATNGYTTQDATLARLELWLATAGADGRRMTHAELARQLGYSLPYVYRIFGGKPITPAFRGRFMAVFGAQAAGRAFGGQSE